VTDILSLRANRPNESCNKFSRPEAASIPGNVLEEFTFSEAPIAAKMCEDEAHSLPFLQAHSVLASYRSPDLSYGPEDLNRGVFQR